MKPKGKKRFRRLFVILLIIGIVGYLLPQKLVMPVKGAAKQDYNQESFWYYPWGKSITHKGVDIFAHEGTPVVSATHGIVIFRMKDMGIGGNTVVVLGPKWRLHYYAHLAQLDCRFLSPVSTGTVLGSVGTTGNAKGKPPHLHYSIFTPVPYPWRIDGDKLGWMKMFFLNPIVYLNELY